MGATHVIQEFTSCPFSIKKHWQNSSVTFKYYHISLLKGLFIICISILANTTPMPIWQPDTQNGPPMTASLTLVKNKFLQLKQSDM